MLDKVSKDSQNTEEQPDKTISRKLEIYEFINQLKTGIWLVGIPSWLFGITDRSLSAFTDGNLSVREIFQLLTTLFFFISWLYLKPDNNLSEDVALLCQLPANKFDLKKRHMISQEYLLPFPYLCQIYHLLNLKHLETIHKFSLNNLKIHSIIDFQPTTIGGKIKFTTVLDSPFNPLRIWRQPIVEVDLILHTPYTVELSIPVYNNKKIVVIFYAIPLTEREHQLFIEIYSDLEWPKPILQVLLHFAACLTLFEDLPYLRNLAEVNIERVFRLSRFSRQSNMLLFKRFVELYGSNREATKLITGGN